MATTRTWKENLVVTILVRQNHKFLNRLGDEANRRGVTPMVLRRQRDDIRGAAEPDNLGFVTVPPDSIASKSVNAQKPVTSLLSNTSTHHESAVLLDYTIGGYTDGTNGVSLKSKPDITLPLNQKKTPAKDVAHRHGDGQSLSCSP